MEQMGQRFAALGEALQQSRVTEDGLNANPQRLTTREANGSESRRSTAPKQALSPIIDARAHETEEFLWEGRKLCAAVDCDPSVLRSHLP